MKHQDRMYLKWLQRGGRLYDERLEMERQEAVLKPLETLGDEEKDPLHGFGWEQDI